MSSRAESFIDRNEERFAKLCLTVGLVAFGLQTEVAPEPKAMLPTLGLAVLAGLYLEATEVIKHQ